MFQKITGIGLATLICCSIASANMDIGNGIAKPDVLRDLARSGAPEFALAYVNDAQRTFTNEQHWLDTETIRLELYEQLNAWDKIAARVPLYDAIDFIEPEMRAATKLQRAQALVNLQQYGEAAAQLNELSQNSQLFEYADMSEFADLQTRILLESGQYDEARDALVFMLADDDNAAQPQLEQLAFTELMLNKPISVPPKMIFSGSTLHAYQLISQLQQGQVSSEAMLANLERIMSEAVSRSAEPAFAVAKILALRAGKQVYEELSAIEAFFNLRQDLDQVNKLLDLSMEQVWNKYQQLGVLALTNIIKDAAPTPDQMFTYALQAGVSSEVKKRAMLSVLFSQTSDYEAAAHEHFTQSLVDEGKEWFLVQLYNAESPDSVASLPAVARYILVSSLLNFDRGIPAAELLLDLEAAPEGQSQYEWDLQRARVFIRYGQLAQGIAMLDSLFEGIHFMDDQEISRAMQLGFDLQTVHAHDAAIKLFSDLLPKTQSLQLKRELFFWVADSYKALNDYEQSSRLYLKSATLDNPFAYDPWAQTARFQAAESLTEAGFLSDARSIYNGLYRATQNPQRRASIRQKLDTLSLLQAHDL